MSPGNFTAVLTKYPCELTSTERLACIHSVAIITYESGPNVSRMLDIFYECPP